MHIVDMYVLLYTLNLQPCAPEHMTYTLLSTVPSIHEEVHGCMHNTITLVVDGQVSLTPSRIAHYPEPFHRNMVLMQAFLYFTGLTRQQYSLELLHLRNKFGLLSPYTSQHLASLPHLGRHVTRFHI